MSPQQLFLLAVAGMAILAASRLVRVRLGRTPHLEGIARRLFVVAFVLVPPIALGALIQPTGTADRLGGIGSVPAYILMLAALGTLMWVAAAITRRIARGRLRRVLLLALVGSEGDPQDVSFDPPVTAKLAGSIALVDATNAAFPRGLEFPAQIDRAGFRGDWDALDAATGELEREIADDYGLGLTVASAATDTAGDARSRLDTLRRLAGAHGQAWAAG
jgi:hypothetical protein